MLEQRERWMELAALATKEQDPHKLLELVQEINSLLDEKRRRPGGRRNTFDSPRGHGSGEG